jgi:hypothetical protein
MLLLIVICIILGYFLKNFFFIKPKKEKYINNNQQYSRICVLGDLHGDKDNAKKALIKAKLIDNNDNWIGGNSFLIQMGDQVDALCRKLKCKAKNYMDTEVISYIDSLQSKANNKGGRVLSILGNHEIMNVQGDINFVSKSDIDRIGGKDKRIELFKAGNKLSKRLSKRPLIYKYKDYLFCHGGLTMSMLNKYSVEQMNHMTEEWLLGNKSMPNFLNDMDSPIWSRKYTIEPEIYHKELDEVLKITETKMMFVGHTVIDRIKSRYNNKLWMTDVGISDKFQGTAIEILEIELDSGKINIIY